MSGVFGTVVERKQAEREAWKMVDLIDQLSYFHIFPYTIQGCINVTETGLKPENLNLNDYTFFSKVISGDQPVVATPEDSTFWIGKPTRYPHMQNEMGAKKKYQVGKFVLGEIQEEVQGLKISSNQAFGAEMTNLQESQTISLLTTVKLQREDVFKLFIIKRYDALDNFFITPDTDLTNLTDRNQVQFLYLQEARSYYTQSGKFAYSKLVFDSLNDKLADTGYSIANYVQLARPGEAYPWHKLKLVEKKDIPIAQRIGSFPKNDRRWRPPARAFLDKWIIVELDPWKTIDVGVWGCQVKIDNRLSSILSA